MKKILIVDDEPHLRLLLEATISAGDCKVINASDGMEAVTTAYKEVPDLILLDIAMPRMDGFEACRLLKAHPRTRDVPIFIITARKRSEDLARWKQLGANYFFTKPYSPTALLEKVNEILSSDPRKQEKAR